MKIKEKIEEVQSNLIKAVIETKSCSKEESVKRLEQLGLAQESATRLILAYRNAESAANTAKNIWDTAMNSKSGVDFSTDIAKSQQEESETRQDFENMRSENAILLVANAIEPDEINEEILKILYEQDIQESKITNPALKITFHYYSESRAKDIQRAEELGKVKAYASRIGTQMSQLKNQLQESENQNKQLRSSNEALQTAYENLQTKFQTRIESDERHYQAALNQIRALKVKLQKIQKRGIFKSIGDKITRIFGNKNIELPEATTEIPDTLFEDRSEAVGMQKLDETELLLLENRQVTYKNDKSNDKEEQK